MEDIRFEWDEPKNRENKRKHGVSFEEAQTVFFDENAIRYYDPDHSESEDRFIMLGLSLQLRLWWCAIAFGRTTEHSDHFSEKADKREAGRLQEVT